MNFIAPISDKQLQAVSSTFAMRSSGGYRGMASWTGTMFEYLMPELFLPLTQDSLLYETAKFCVYVQKKRRSRGAFFSVLCSQSLMALSIPKYFSCFS